MPDFQKYYDRMMAKGSKVNLFYLWLDYKQENPNGYQTSQFYEYFRRFVADNYGGKNVSMPVERIPGEKMYIDWVGDRPELLVDPSTGEIKKVSVFATTLGVSSLVYAEVFWTKSYLVLSLERLTLYSTIIQWRSEIPSARQLPYRCEKE